MLAAMKKVKQHTSGPSESCLCFWLDFSFSVPMGCLLQLLIFWSFSAFHSSYLPFYTLLSYPLALIIQPFTYSLSYVKGKWIFEQIYCLFESYWLSYTYLLHCLWLIYWIANSSRLSWSSGISTVIILNNVTWYSRVSIAYIFSWSQWEMQFWESQEIPDTLRNSYLADKI